MKKNVITSAILLAIPALAAAEEVAKLDVINVYSASAPQLAFIKPPHLLLF